MILRLALLLALLPAAALADACDDAAGTQAAAIGCAVKRLQAADAGLNAAYKAAIARAQDFDRNAGPEDKGAEKSLRAAQRAWLAYRDAACTAEAWLYHGGTMAPMVEADCQARLSGQRAADLKLTLTP